MTSARMVGIASGRGMATWAVGATSSGTAVPTTALTDGGARGRRPLTLALIPSGVSPTDWAT